MKDTALKAPFLEGLIDTLHPLVKQLQQSNSLENKLFLLDAYLKKENIDVHLKDLNLPSLNGDTKREFITKMLFALRQEKVIFPHFNGSEKKLMAMEALIKELWEIEIFYSFIGGLAGYYYTVIKLLVEEKKGSWDYDELEKFQRPEGVNVDAMNQETFALMTEGIKYFGQMGAIFPVGGAKDPP